MLFLYLTLFFIVLIYYFTKTRKALHMLQQNLYNENQRYLKWLGENLKNAFWHLDLLGFVLSIPFFYIKDDIAINVLLILLCAFYVVCIYRSIMHARNDQNKKPLVTTARIKRLWVTLLVIFMAPVVFGIVVERYLPLTQLLIALLVIGSYVLVYLANLINYPVERMVFHHFARKAKKKLALMNQLKVIGITGSYGKTSCKNILNDILSTKYIVRPTPKNFNTYNGLMITINNHLDKFDEFFIAEMGAYTRGDIKGLCDMVHPQYGILTTIGTAHLSSFGSEENIQKTKFELIESLPEDGVAVLNKDDPKQVNYQLQNKVKKIWIGIDNITADLLAKNIKCTNKGTSFDLVIRGDKKNYPFETKLLGKHNVYNLLASIALGLEFGIKIPELQQAVRKVKAVEHRLELKRLGDMYQIDDAYNSNPVGAKMALEVLGMMDGTKVVVTPGMTELGKKENKYNKIFGTQMKGLTDYVILVGKKHTEPIYEGLIESGFDKDKIFILNDVRKAYPLVSQLKTKDEDIYALFENDLPDSLLTNEE